MKSLILKSLFCLFTSLFAASLSFAQDVLDLSQYHGKVVYVDFWASWCGPCKQSFPWMNEMQAKYGDQGLVVIAVNVDTEAGAAKAFLDKHPAQFQIAYDPEGSLASKYNLQGMPSSFVFDRQGNLVKKHVGFSDNKTAHYEQSIKDLL